MKKWMALGFAVLISVGAYADGPGGSARRVEGEEALRNNTALFTQIQWHETLQSALAEAGKSGRLVFWIHVKGDFEGAT
jgi:hypothetical protein